jgi:serine/threonine protein kinase
MATSPPDDSGLATPDLPHSSPAPDFSTNEVTPASLPYDLLGLSLSIDPEPPSQSLEHLLSSIEDDMYTYQVPEHTARARRSVEGRKGATLLRLQGVDGLEIIPELLEGPGDSPVSDFQVIKGPNSVESSKAPGTSDLTANGFSGRTGSRYSNTFPHSSDQVSVTSLQTFETALSSIGSYTTASSGPRAVSHVGRWTASNTEKWLAQNNTLPGSTLPWHQRAPFYGILSYEPLLRSIESVHGGFPRDLRAAIRMELLPLCDPLWNPTSVESSFKGLISRIEQICSSHHVTLDKKVFTGKVEQIIWEYVAKQPHLQHAVRDTLSAYEPFGSQWLQLLKAHSLILDPKEALDWSGRGQHVEYALEEQENIPLVLKGNLGFGASGIVDRVRCRRIDLARKTIRCIRPLTRQEAAKEVRHLQQLQHRHVVRLVGTYMLKKNLSILMYPATEHSLDGFLDIVHDQLSCFQVAPDIQRYHWGSRLLRLIACLINAVAFIHAQNTKHMDIKPNNILVDFPTLVGWARVYITDFGIARSYRSTEESFTDSPISYTRTYTAPEVAQQTVRGPPADIFSLGCVFAEILATQLSMEGDCQQERLRQLRNQGADNSYQANVTNVIGWYESLNDVRKLCLCHLGHQCYHRWAHILPKMLSIRPEDRPTAIQLKTHTQHFACGSCDDGPEPFKAAT